MANCCDSIIVDLTPQNVVVDLWQSPSYLITLKSYIYTLQFMAAGMGPPGPQGPPGLDSTVPGPPGAPGSAGLPGTPGAAATCDSGITATLPPGAGATVSNVGTTSAAIFNFGIPQGIPGPVGGTGPPGATGNPGPPLNAKGSVPTAVDLPSTGNSVGDFWTTDDTGYGYVWGGISWINMGQWRGNAGTAGAQGPPGNPGTAATADAGTTFTLAPGTLATVTNVGSTSAAVFNFGIPQGIAGPAGAQGNPGAPGGPGAAGPPGANSWTLTTASFTVPPVGQTVVVNVSDTSWAVLGEFVWVATAGGSPSQPAALQITAKTPTTLTLLNPPSSGMTPSSDPNNLLELGSDGLLYLPPSQIQPTIWSVRLRSFNAIGNPNTECNQRNPGIISASATPGAGTSGWLIDRWGYVLPAAPASISVQNPASRIALPNTNFLLSQQILRLTLLAQSTSLAASDRLVIYQIIEGPPLRELINDVTSVSLLVSSSVANLQFGLAICDPTGTRSLTKLCTIPTANTLTIIPLSNLPVMPAAGTFNIAAGNAGYQLSIVLAAGSTYVSPANDTWQNGNFYGAVGQGNFCAQPVNSTFNVAFVQHEPGPLCTQLMDCPFSQNLLDCERYFQKSCDYQYRFGQAVSGGQVYFYCEANANPYTSLSFKRRMAKSPTVTIWNPVSGASGTIRNYSTSADLTVASLVAIGEASYGGCQVSAPPTAANLVGWHYIADTGW